MADIKRPYVLVRLLCGLADDPTYGGQQRCTQPKCGNCGFLDTDSSELGRQLGQAVPESPSSQVTHN